MFTQIQDFMTEQKNALADQAQKFRDDPVESARGVATQSAENLKSLKDPIRTVARSGIKLTAISQNALQGFIELQSESVTAALTDAANRLERAARADSFLDLLQDQADSLGATRDRLIDEASRAFAIVKDATLDAGKVASQVYAKVVETAEEEAPVARAKRPARKTTARAKKAA